MIGAITTFSVVINVILGLAVLLRNPKSATHKLFALLAINQVIWAVVNHISLVENDPKQAILWIRVVMVITATMFPTIY